MIVHTETTKSREPSVIAHQMITKIHFAFDNRVDFKNGSHLFSIIVRDNIAYFKVNGAIMGSSDMKWDLKPIIIRHLKPSL